MPLKDICLILNKCIKTKRISTMFTLGSYMKKQNYGTERFNNKAYASAAKALIRNPVDPKFQSHQVKPVVFYGDAGQGHGLRIKGYQRRSTTKLQKSLKGKATVHETNDILDRNYVVSVTLGLFTHGGEIAPN
ncbi:hypothetical protein BC941DRAFT_467575 [Chlamydoabsidia padenii]|nr:hypothetical protein BC941DRAFT_467575 [Chlamydoabsidia padenii]